MVGAKEAIVSCSVCRISRSSCHISKISSHLPLLHKAPPTSGDPSHCPPTNHCLLHRRPPARRPPQPQRGRLATWTPQSGGKLGGGGDSKGLSACVPALCTERAAKNGPFHDVSTRHQRTPFATTAVLQICQVWLWGQGGRRGSTFVDRDCGLLGRAVAMLDVQILFKRLVQTQGGCMNFQQFITALGHLAALQYPDSLNTQQAFGQFMRDRLLPLSYRLQPH
jgi:hypothetical protein